MCVALSHQRPLSVQCLLKHIEIVAKTQTTWVVMMWNPPLSHVRTEEPYSCRHSTPLTVDQTHYQGQCWCRWCTAGRIALFVSWCVVLSVCDDRKTVCLLSEHFFRIVFNVHSLMKTPLTGNAHALILCVFLYHPHTPCISFTHLSMIDSVSYWALSQYIKLMSN